MIGARHMHGTLQEVLNTLQGYMISTRADGQGGQPHPLLITPMKQISPKLLPYYHALSLRRYLSVPSAVCIPIVPTACG